MAWGEAARRAFYVRKHGEEEGEERFQQWMLEHEGEAIRQDGDVSPKPRARPAGKPRPADVYAAMATAIYALDTCATWVSPTWVQERLTQEEIGRLAQATGDEVLNSKQLTAWLMRASKSGVHVKLALVVASIAIPRMKNHGMLPAQVAADAADVASGGARSNQWTDGQWEVGADEQAPGYEELVRTPEEQSGFDEVPENTPEPIRGRNGRPTSNEDHLAAALREAVAGVQ